MQKVPYTNDGSSFQHVGGTTIPPGETRDVDPSLLPDWKPESDGKPQEAPDPLLELLGGSIASVLEVLPAMTDGELEQLAALEAANKGRKGLLEAVAAEQLRRATLPPKEDL